MDDCVFCEIVAGSPRPHVYEDEQVVAFKDINPETKTHLLFVPKKHVVSVDSVEDFAWFEKAFKAISETIKKLDLKDYKIVINGGKLQQVKHLHIHLMSERG